MGVWLKRLSILALLGFPIALAGYRVGLHDFSLAFLIIMGTTLLAVAVFFIAMVVSFVQRNSNAASSKAARTAALISLIPIVFMGNQAYTGKSVPGIHNISTDVLNPPSFDTVIALRGEGSNPHEYDASVLAEQQQAAYPGVKTLFVSDSKQQAHSKALELVSDFGWELVNEDASQGIIEATETTLLWQFKDDIVIRITSQGGQTAIDLRSVSRIGRSDLGANAKRIEKFLNAYK